MRVAIGTMTTWALLAVLLTLHAGTARALEPRSDYELLSDDLKQMQNDEFANPGMLTVEKGRTLFAKPGYNGKACASCHGKDGAKLDPVAIAAYPVYEPKRGPVTLQSQINNCWSEHMDEFPMLYDADALVALETFVRYLARGQPVHVDIRGPMRAHYEAGRRLFMTRIGQRGMACVQCHEQHAGQHLRGQVLNQAQVNGFPIYRITNGHILSLHQKYRGCYATLRAMPYQPGSEEYIDLEVYMSARGNGLPIETPAIRR